MDFGHVTISSQSEGLNIRAILPYAKKV